MNDLAERVRFEIEEDIRYSTECPECGALRDDDHAWDCPWNEEGDEAYERREDK